jgi:hypothetical protein
MRCVMKVCMSEIRNASVGKERTDSRTSGAFALSFPIGFQY